MNRFNEYAEQVRVLTNSELVDAKKYYEGVIGNIKSVAGQFEVDDEYFKYTTIVGIINQELKERA